MAPHTLWFVGGALIVSAMRVERLDEFDVVTNDKLTSKLCNNSYDGDWVEIDEVAQKHGQGYCEFDKFGSNYNGSWVNNTPTGTGTVVMMLDKKGKNKNVYEGELENGIYQGWGTMLFANGDTFDGSWENGKRVSGTQKFASGGQYVGELKDDAPHGEGRSTFVNGAIYEGNFVLGKPEGRGKYTFPNGVIYDGTMTDGKMTGMGAMFHVNGDIIRGQFAEGRACGEGVVESGMDGRKFKACDGNPIQQTETCTKKCPTATASKKSARKRRR